MDSSSGDDSSGGSGSESCDSDAQEWKAYMKQRNVCSSSVSDLMHFGGWVYYQGSRCGRITTKSGDADELVYVVQCSVHDGCTLEVPGSEITRSSLLAWLRQGCSCRNADEPTDALAELRCEHSRQPPQVRADERLRNKIAFRPWSVSRIREGNRWIAWGANCNQHGNAHQPHLRCKRSLQFHGRVGMPEAEARVRMKMWLLAGAKILDGPRSKDAHFDIDPVRDFPVLEDEAELDRRAGLLV